MRNFEELQSLSSNELRLINGGDSVWGSIRSWYDFGKTVGRVAGVTFAFFANGFTRMTHTSK